ncbi:Rho-GAP domain-containing protein [Trichostrongylus colubriformis]|uniref:Rho-GAP domain-containing protein n=1 Tax=Trichostrongylus colubriformis TaxID=6319 RepID=A0AAN8FY55_TRICO
MNEFRLCSVTPSTIRCRLPSVSDGGEAGSFHRLGNVLSVDVELELHVREGGRNGITKLKLKQVPKFLVNAFNVIIKDGLECEGLFRREGNATRLNKNYFTVFLGEDPIPEGFTVHDVCSMVKRFFRDLRVPLLPNVAVRKALLELVKKNEKAPVTRHDFCSIFEPDITKRSLDRSLPEAHIGTLGYLMRQLLGISRHANKHQMDAANLATVFAPTIFREKDEKSKRKERRGSQDDVLTSVIESTQLKIAAVQLLIERANWIGLHPNCYVTSVSHQRSSSAAASPRQPFMSTSANFKEPPPRPEKKQVTKRNAPSVPLVHDRKASLKIEDTGNVKSSTKRRSSSAFRGIINGIGDRLLKRSPSRERNKTSRRQSSPAVVVTDALQQHRARLSRRPSPRYMLEFAESPPASGSSEIMNAGDDQGLGPLRSSSTRTSRSRQPVAVNAARLPAHKGQQIDTSGITGSHSIGRSSYRSTEAPICRRDSGKKRGGTPPKRVNKVLKDNPVSMLGEEYFNPSYREQHERSRRRHTTPVKTSTALRRNQPNTRHSGLHQPKRRATVVNVHEQEKENRHRTGSISGTNSCEDIEGTLTTEDSLTLTDSSTDILTQKGHESRMRRAKRQQRRELSSILQDSLFDTSSFQEPVERKDSEKDRVIKVSVGCSPIIFPRTPDISKTTHGSAIVGETRVITPISIPPLPDDSLPDNLPTDLCISPPPSEPQSTARPLMTTHSPSKTAAVVSKHTPLQRLVPPERNVRPFCRDDKQPQCVAFRVPSLPTRSTDSLPVLDSSSVRVGNIDSEKKRKAPSRPMSPNCLLSASLPQRVQKSSSADEDRSDRFAMQSFNNPTSIRGAGSTSASINRDEMFVPSKEMKEALLNSNCDEDMEAAIGRHLRLRPSVAFIQKQGIVRDRVNMFRQLGNSMSVPMEPVSGRSSGMSSRSSLGAGSLTGDDEFVKPSAPPVTHSLNMGGLRRNSAAASSAQCVNSPSSK